MKQLLLQNLMPKNKKGFTALQGIILSVVIIAIVLAVGLLILSKFSGKLPENSTERQAVMDIITELSSVAGYVGILIIVAIFGIIIGYLITWFSRRGSEGAV